MLYCVPGFGFECVENPLPVRAVLKNRGTAGATPPASPPGKATDAKARLVSEGEGSDTEVQTPTEK